jgi:protoheme IX farnesyltransferase
MLVHRFAIATAIATYLLILIGGLVHGTGSSLACPDWPTCYGSLMPKMEGGVLVEHSHRLAAAMVVLMTLVLAVMLARSATPVQRRLRPYGWLAVALVFVQAVLGGVTVLLRLPSPVSTAHTATSLLLFLTVFYIALRSRPASAAVAASAPLPARATWLALFAAVAVYFQMVLGGLVRHSGAALACTDVPLCRGALWPDAHPTVLIHVLHRLNALVVAALVTASAVATFRAGRGRPALRALALAAPVLVATQIWLGIRAVLTFLDLATVEAHLGVATALLATQVALVLRGRPEAAPGAFRLRWIWDLVSLAKPRVTGLVILTFVGGMWMAPGSLDRWRAIMCSVGLALIVGASNAFNMLIERDVDPLMERTRNRALPRGLVSPEAALAFGTALACASLPLLFLGGNLVTGLLGLLALVSYVGVYTPMKRHSGAALFVGAVPGAIPPLMGWTVVTGKLDPPALVLFAVLFLWQIPHFLAIAVYRSADYARAGIKVLPLALSPGATRTLIVGFSVALVAATVLLEPLRVAGRGYAVAAALLGATLVAWALAGYGRAATRAWARSLFLFSIVYLMLLFAALVIDRTVV